MSCMIPDNYTLMNYIKLIRMKLSIGDYKEADHWLQQIPLTLNFIRYIKSYGINETTAFVILEELDKVELDLIGDD